MIIKDLTKL